MFVLFNAYKVKPGLNGLKEDQKLISKTDYHSMQVKSIAECILQYYRPSLSYHLSLRPLFCLFLSGCLSDSCTLTYFTVSDGDFFTKADINRYGTYNFSPGPSSLPSVSIWNSHSAMVCPGTPLILLCLH